MTTPHRATPEQWTEQEIWAASDSDSSCLLELRDRLAAAEQRISELEQLQSWVPPTTADFLDALDARLTALEGNSSAGLTGSNHPAKPDSSAPAFEPPELSDEEVGALWDEPSQACARRIYRAGWDAAMAALNLRQQDEDADRAAAGSLVAHVNTAMDLVYHERGTSDGEAMAAILAVAEWLDGHQVGVGRVSARWLREEVERG